MGSILGGKSKSSSSTTANVVVPSWLDKQNKSVVSRAVDLADNPYQSYTGQRVADFSADTNSALALNRSNVGKYNPLLNTASSGVQQLMQRANGPSSTDIQSLMNPYIQNVLDTQRRKAAEVAGDDQAALKRQAALSGSFGGSRFAVQQQKQAQDLANQMNDIEYQGMSDAFKNAMDQWNTGTSTLNQGITQALTTANQGQQYDTNDIANLLKAGALQEDKTQQGLDVAYSDWDTQQAYPYEQLTWLSNILNPLTGAYAGTETTGTQKSKSGGGLGSVLGAAASIYSMMPSDKRVKENIEHVGELDNGLKVYKYNYKGDPRTQIGLMAQEVEKTNPDAVSEFKGIKMVNYDKATKEEGYASGGVVTYPELMAALKEKTSSAGSPNFVSPPQIKQDSSNPILDMLKSGSVSSLGGSSKGGGLFTDISDWFRGINSNAYAQPIGPTMTANSSGFFGMFKDGGYVENLLDSDEEDARKRAEFYYNQSLGNDSPSAEDVVGDIPTKGSSVSDYLKQGSEKFLNDANTWSDYTKPSPDDSYAKRMGKNALHTTEATLPLLLGKALEAASDSSSSTKSLYDDLFVTPMSQLDAERNASHDERDALNKAIQAKVNGDNYSFGEGLMPTPMIDPKTGEPAAIGMGIGQGPSDMSELLKSIPQVDEEQVQGNSPAPEENDIMSMLRKELISTKQPETVKEDNNGINMPLLMAGLAMMASKGDTAQALAEGASAFMGTKGNIEKSKQDEEDRAEAQKQKRIKSLLDYLKIQAYIQQVNGKSNKALTPYQQMMLELKSRGLDIQQQNADTKRQSANQFQTLFGQQPGLTPDTGNDNLNDLLDAFMEQESSQQNSSPSLDSILNDE